MIPSWQAADEQIDIAELVKAHMEKHKINEFIVELAGCYQINDYYDYGGWNSPNAPADVDPTPDYIPTVSSKTVVAGDMTLQHPGVLFNKTMPDSMVTKVRAKEDPWHSIYPCRTPTKALRARKSSQTRTIQRWFAALWRTIYCTTPSGAMQTPP